MAVCARACARAFRGNVMADPLSPNNNNNDINNNNNCEEHGVGGDLQYGYMTSSSSNEWTRPKQWPSSCTSTVSSCVVVRGLPNAGLFPSRPEDENWP